jgi:hypothetical protein
MTSGLPKYNCSRALIVGINDYSYASPLGYAVNDAEAVANLLRESFGFDAPDIKLLLNKNATRNSIHKAFLDFSKHATDLDDRLLIFFAGHGHTERTARGDIGYLVPVDGDPADLSSLIRWDTITRDADLIEAKHILFVMDACYSGLAITRSLQPGSSRFLKDMLQRGARQVLTAGKANEVVADLGGPRADHSVFTGHFLDALEGAAASSGIITANGVMAYVYHKVSADPDSRQTPHYGYLNGDGDFIFNPPPPMELGNDTSKVEDTLIQVPGAVHASQADNTQSIAARVKSLLANDEDRIKLHDLVVQETRLALAAVSTDTFVVEGKWSNEEFADRLFKYNEATAALRAVQMLLGFWGTDAHRNILLLPAKRIAEQVTIASGLSVWLSLRWYPVLVLTYSCGLGAVAAEHYSNLRVLLHAALPDQRQRFGKTQTLIHALYADLTGMDGAFKSIPGHERQYVPVSEYLFKELQPLADDVLFLGSDYDRIFDRVEILLSLECAHLEGGWAPMGRFAWKYSSRVSTANPFRDLIDEAESAGVNWGPIKGGFFSGSIDKFNSTVEAFMPLIDRLQWW